MKIRGYNNKSRIRQRQEEAIERLKVHSVRTPEQQLKHKKWLNKYYLV